MGGSDLTNFTLRLRHGRFEATNLSSKALDWPLAASSQAVTAPRRSNRSPSPWGSLYSSVFAMGSLVSALSQALSADKLSAPWYEVWYTALSAGGAMAALVQIAGAAPRPLWKIGWAG